MSTNKLQSTPALSPASVAHISLSDKELYDWIDQLSFEELQDVVKYLVLLNADVVQSAMKYVQRRKPSFSTRGRGRTTAREEEQVPPLRYRSRSHDVDDDYGGHEDSSDLAMGASSAIWNDSKQSSIASGMVSFLIPPPPNMNSHNNQHSSNNNNNNNNYHDSRSFSYSYSLSNHSRSRSYSQSRSTSTTGSNLHYNYKFYTLVIVCTMKPTTKQQAIEQDKSMALCKSINLIPYIILAESKPQHTQELFSIVPIYGSQKQQPVTYPQFFLQYQQNVDYIGDYTKFESKIRLLQQQEQQSQSQSQFDHEDDDHDYHDQIDQDYNESLSVAEELLLVPQKQPLDPRKVQVFNRMMNAKTIASNSDSFSGDSIATSNNNSASSRSREEKLNDEDNYYHEHYHHSSPKRHAHSSTSRTTATTTAIPTSPASSSSSVASASSSSVASSSNAQAVEAAIQYLHQKAATTTTTNTNTNAPTEKKSTAVSLHAHLSNMNQPSKQSEEDRSYVEEMSLGSDLQLIFDPPNLSSSRKHARKNRNNSSGNIVGGTGKNNAIRREEENNNRHDNNSRTAMTTIQDNDGQQSQDRQQQSLHTTTIHEEDDETKSDSDYDDDDYNNSSTGRTKNDDDSDDDQNNTNRSLGNRIESNHCEEVKPIPSTPKSQPKAASPLTSQHQMTTSPLHVSSHSKDPDTPKTGNVSSSSATTTAQGSVTMSSSPSGTWKLRETVTLKPPGSRRVPSSIANIDPPTTASSSPTTVEWQKAKVSLKPATERIVKSTIENPTNMVNNNENKQKPNIVNPYYALDKYGKTTKCDESHDDEVNSTTIKDDLANGDRNQVQDIDSSSSQKSDPSNENAISSNHTPKRDPLAITVEAKLVSSPIPISPSSAMPSSSPGEPAWMQVYQQQEEHNISDDTQKHDITTTTTETTAAAADTSLASSKSDHDSRAAPEQRGLERKKSWEKQFMGNGACYLVYDAVEGELNIHYSEVPIIGAVGVWTSPDISVFKESQGLSKSELIGNCASGVADRVNYYHGWCQFIKAAKSMDAAVTVLEVGVPVDFYLYQSGHTIKVEKWGTFETSSIDAVACVPRNCEFPIGVKGKKWSKAAKKMGSLALFRPLNNKDGDDTKKIEDTRQNLTFIDAIPAREPVKDSKDTKIVPQEESQQKMPDPRLQYQPPDSPTAETPKQTNSHSPVDPATAPSLTIETSTNGDSEAHSFPTDAPTPKGGACYLVYEPDSSGRLVEHHSLVPVENAIGRWTPGADKKIAGFKFKRNLGRNVLIGNCSAGVQGRKNYCSGWCQFVRSAKVLDGDVMLWDPLLGNKGMTVDVFLYYNDSRPTHQTKRLEQGVPYSTDNLVAVACIPKNTPFFEGMAVDLLKWLADGSTYGYSSKMV